MTTKYQLTLQVYLTKLSYRIVFNFWELVLIFNDEFIIGIMKFCTCKTALQWRIQGRLQMVSVKPLFDE